MEILLLQVPFFSLKFVGRVFISLLHDFMSFSQIIAESFIKLVKYFLFSELDVAGFQT